MIPTDGKFDALTANALLQSAGEYLPTYDVTREALAAAIGTNAAYVSTLFSESKRGVLFTPGSKLPAETRDKLLRDIANWLEEDFRGRCARKPDNFVLTAAAEAIVAAARRIRATRTIGIVGGPAGIGKTTTARDAVPAELPGTMYVFVNYDCRNPPGLLLKIYAACAKRRDPKARPTLADIVERLKGSGRLLIIDQAHDLKSDGCFRLLMNLHEEAELPIVLLGTRAIHDRLSDAGDPEFGQLSSRVGIRVNLWSELFQKGKGGRPMQWVSVAELRTMFARSKVRVESDVWRALAQIANFETGHFRRVKHLLRLAEAAARGGKSDIITMDHLRAAVKLVEGEERALIVPAETPGVEAATA